MFNYTEAGNTVATIKAYETLLDNCIEYSNSKIFNTEFPECKWIYFASDLAKYIEYDLKNDNLDFTIPNIVDHIYGCISTIQSSLAARNDQDIVFSIDLPNNNVAIFIIPFEVAVSTISGVYTNKIIYRGDYKIIKSGANPIEKFDAIRNITNFDNFRKYKER